MEPSDRYPDCSMRVITENQSFPESAQRSVLVPTMGALHEGHIALVRRAVEVAKERDLCAGCTVSIFVNPTQFDVAADYDRYARVLQDDIKKCAQAGASTVFAPSTGAVYPPDEPQVHRPMPDSAIGKGLEDAHRPGHFEGVCQVVRRLFELAKPAAAIFGEKDWQQYTVVRAMAAEDRSGIDVIASATVRESDGLAMSSRNRFLPESRREQALSLNRALKAAQLETTPEAAEASMLAVFRHHGIGTPDYAVVRDAQTLGPYQPGRPGRVIVAAAIEAEPTAVRLLDNAAWPG